MTIVLWIILGILIYMLIGFVSMGIYIVFTGDKSNWESTKKLFYAWPIEIFKIRRN